ncbi:MAG: zinc-ribbon domain-containing protein [Acidobacteriia bacterium]|nr:zinc-ribbon domain-containing protein [Terriglobia bacterium]
MFCQFCGAKVDSNVRFCPTCGKPLAPGAAGPAPGVLPNYQPPIQPPPTFTAPPGTHAQIGHWISSGWNIVKADLGTFMVMSLVFVVLNSVVPIILQGPLIAGFYIVCARKVLYGRFEFGDLFKGFNFFVAALVASILIAIFTFIGTLFCIIPGLVLAAMYMFTYLFIIDKRMDFWPAMQASHSIVRNDYFGFTLFLIAVVLLNIVGLVCCLVGVLATMPILYAAVTVAYKEIVGFEPNPNF